MTDPRLLRPFVALADELHFGRAAERLHVTQPALSQQIARLERQLGVRLFDRTRTRVELTEAGTAMLPAARTAVESAAAAAEIARGHARGEAGELRLGLSPGAHYVAQPLLAEFARRRPKVRVRARQDSSGALAEQVADGRLELALGFCTEPRDGVVCAWLRDEPVVVAVAAGHPLADRGRVRLADLAGETLALVDARDGAGYNRAVVALCREAGFEPRTRTDPHGPMAWETAVRSEGCVGLTTRSSAPSTARDVRLLELDPPATFPLELVQPAAPETAWRPAARAFAALTASFARRELSGPS
jgi:LysR family transcriptional regulator, benzoate and cis,cis-muconate-responsive activator of ben and cat genes